MSGNAINLNAGDALVNMGDVLDSTFSGGDFTVSLWVKTLSTAIDTIVISKHEGGSQNGNFIGINTSAGFGQISRTYFYTADSPGGEVISTSPVTDNVWRQIVAVYNAGGQKFIYVDGTPVEDSGLATTITGNNADFLIGGVWFTSGPTDRYFGWVDNVQIYDGALSPDEIQFLFANPGATNPVPIPARLVVRLRNRGPRTDKKKGYLERLDNPPVRRPASAGLFLRY